MHHFFYMQSFQFHVTGEAAGRRLDEFLAARLDWLSRMRIASLLEEGACLVNRATGRAGQRVGSGDCVEVELEEGARTAMSPEPLPLDIIYEDDCLLVLVKPAGMLVHPTRGVKGGTLANALAFHLNRTRLEKRHEALVEEAKGLEAVSNPAPLVRPGLVHRLDRATSGLMVVAKEQHALSRLTRHFHRRLVAKRYLALVHGLVAANEREVNAPIGRDPAARPQWRIKADGKPALTRLRVLKRTERLTLVELEPVTGRTNQLRIHCAHLDHPIVGDSLHGIEDEAARLCLHASRLAFHHPATNEWMEFHSPLPDEIAAKMKG